MWGDCRVEEEPLGQEDVHQKMDDFCELVSLQPSLCGLGRDAVLDLVVHDLVTTAVEEVGDADDVCVAEDDLLDDDKGHRHCRLLEGLLELDVAERVEHPDQCAFLDRLVALPLVEF